MSPVLRILRRYFSVETVKSFNKIPGPKGFLGIGNLYNYYKIIGKYSFDAVRYDWNGLKKYLKYGPIVCERLMPGVSVVWVFDPNDIAEVMTEEPGHYPRRRSHLALEKYRLDRPEIYSSAGLLPTNGEEWWRMRSAFQQPISKPLNVRNFLPKADDTIKSFLNFLPSTFSDSQEIKDMLPELLRVSLELTCLMAFDESMDALSENGRKPNSMASKLMKAARATTARTLPLDQGLPLWRLFNTPMYREFCKAQDYIGSVVVAMVARKQKSNAEGNSLLDQYLKNPKLTVKDIHTMAADLLLGGADTTGFTISFALYHIANHPEIQELMFKEAATVLPDANDSLSASAINSEIPYTRAVLKECLRLNPIAVGVGRITNRDMVLSGYRVPKDTTVVVLNQISSYLEKNFREPLKFKPERWMRDENQKKPDINPYVSLPFGHGTRSCIARRFAEQNLLVLLLRLMRVYKLEWRGCKGPLETVTTLINQPSSDISLKFIKR